MTLSTLEIVVGEFSFGLLAQSACMQSHIPRVYVFKMTDRAHMLSLYLSRAFERGVGVCLDSHGQALC